MMYPTVHKMIAEESQRRATLVIIGTTEQIEMLAKIADSVERGTLVQDMRTLLGRRFLGLED